MSVFSINGYWKDDNSTFTDYLVNEFDDCPEGFNDTDLFYFGLSESQIIQSIIQKENTDLDFIITSYKYYYERQIRE